MSTTPPTLLTGGRLLLTKVQNLERDMQEVRTVVKETKECLDHFISSVTIADQQPGESPREASSRVA